MSVDVKKDEFPGVVVGDLVQAVLDISDVDTGEEIAREGDLGRVVSKGEYSAPTIHWERTDSFGDALPDLQFKIVAEPDFAATQATTPKRTRRDFVRRGMA